MATSMKAIRPAVSEAAIEALRQQIRGAVILPNDASYDEARKVWNGMIDKHPAVIVECTGTADVAAAVNIGREHDIEIAVRGCGHNVAGSAVNNGGLVIDLSKMKSVYVDPDRRTVRVEPGANWGDVDHETQVFGLVTPGGQVSTTGVAGFTLVGGMSFLRRKWGLACDNVVSAQIVTANGDVLNVSEIEHPDLFWAIRGGGGNFGIVTSFEFQLYPLGPEIYAAVTIYPIEEVATVLRNWRDFITTAPDEVTCDLLVWGMPPLPMVSPEMHWSPVVLISSMYAGPVDKGELVLRPARELGTPLFDLSGPRPYVAMQAEIDPLVPDGLQYYWKCINADVLDEPLIEAIVDLAADRPSPRTLLGLRGLGGAMSRVPENATAYGNRSALYNLSFDTTWEDPAQSEEMISWTRSAWSRIHDLTQGGVYLNFTGQDEGGEALARAGYAGNYDRLVEIKRRYDPANLFRGNVNIVP